MADIKIVAMGDYSYTGIGRAIQEPLHYLNRVGGYDVTYVAIGYDGWDKYKDRFRFPFDLIPCKDQESNFLQNDLVRLMEREKSDYFFSASDWWNLNYISFPEMIGSFGKREVLALHKESRSWKWVQYFPLDGLSVGGQLLSQVKSTISRADIPVVPAPFTKKAFDEAGLPVQYIPHYIDTDFWKPLDKVQSRKAWNLPLEAFIVLMVGANQERKLFEDLYECWARFKKGKSNILLIPYTNFDERLLRGKHNHRDLINKFDIADSIVDPSQIWGCSDSALLALYNAADTHILLSQGEGFGYPALQARACEIPSLVQDHTALKDFTPPENSWELIPSRATFISDGNNIVRYLPDHDSVVDKLKDLYRNKDLRSQLGNAGRRFVTQHLSLPVVMPMWQKLFHDNYFSGYEIKKEIVPFNEMATVIFSDDRPLIGAY